MTSKTLEIISHYRAWADDEFERPPRRRLEICTPGRMLHPGAHEGIFPVFGEGVLKFSIGPRAVMTNSFQRFPSHYRTWGYEEA